MHPCKPKYNFSLNLYGHACFYSVQAHVLISRVEGTHKGAGREIMGVSNSKILSIYLSKKEEIEIRAVQQSEDKKDIVTCKNEK